MKTHALQFVLSLSLMAASAPAHATSPIELPSGTGEAIPDFYARLGSYLQDLQGFYTKKPDTEQMKKLMGYYTMSALDRAEYDQMLGAMSTMTPMEWYSVIQSADQEGRAMFLLALYPLSEERATSAASGVAKTELEPSWPEALKSNWSDFVPSPTGVLFAKHAARAVAAPALSPEKRAPLLLGAGFPFNQTQFVEFNQKLTELTDVDLYDPLCTGLSVLYDAVVDGEKLCRPYKAPSAKALLRDELAVRWAHQHLYTYAWALQLPVAQVQDMMFRITRLSFRGVTLVQQARAITTIADHRGYASGEAVLSGLSYGGLTTAKIGAMFPGRFKALVLFSPGIENAAHVKMNRHINALLEGTSIHRRVLSQMVSDTAHSPRYDAYRPVVLNDHDEAFRDSLITKMLGELDMDLRHDLARVQDRVYMVTGALDASVDPKAQVSAMREVFKKPGAKGSFILVPKGGHALWGNPKQAAETAVLRALEEILKGPSGVFHDRGVYAFNDATGGFDLIGEGLQGLDKIEALIDTLKPH